MNYSYWAMMVIVCRRNARHSDMYDRVAWFREVQNGKDVLMSCHGAQYARYDHGRRDSRDV